MFRHISDGVWAKYEDHNIHAEHNKNFMLSLFPAQKVKLLSKMQNIYTVKKAHNI